MSPGCGREHVRATIERRKNIQRPRTTDSSMFTRREVILNTDFNESLRARTTVYCTFFACARIKKFLELSSRKFQYNFVSAVQLLSGLLTQNIYGNLESPKHGFFNVNAWKCSFQCCVNFSYVEWLDEVFQFERNLCSFESNRYRDTRFLLDWIGVHVSRR